MKKNLLCVTLCVCILISMLLSACTGPAATPSGSDSTLAETSTTYSDALSGTNFDPEDVSTWYSDTPSYPTAEDIARIKPGMTLTEVFHIIGLPQKSVGSGKFIMEWETDTNSYLQIFLESESFDVNLTNADRWVVEKVELTDETSAIPLPTYNEPIYDPKDPSTWYSDTPSFPTAEDIAKIQVGYTVTEVFYTIGLPQRDVGSGNMVLEWDLNTGGHLRIAFIENDYYDKLLPLASYMIVESIELAEASNE